MNDAVIEIDNVNSRLITTNSKIKKILSEADLDGGKLLLREIVSLLVGLIRSNSPDRLHEDAVDYRVGGEGKD